MLIIETIAFFSWDSGGFRFEREQEDSTYKWKVMRVVSILSRRDQDQPGDEYISKEVESPTVYFESVYQDLVCRKAAYHGPWTNGWKFG